MTAGRAHEPTKIALQVVDALNDAPEFHHRGLVARTVSEVGVDGLLDGAAPGDQCRLEPAQIAAPRREGGRSVAEMGGALDGEDVTEALRVRELWGDFCEGHDDVPLLLVRVTAAGGGNCCQWGRQRRSAG
ncbi:hypothetical protein GCM10010350_39320 [Streptomyces galilaeus]|nr:hypothetical protein GCM10010350_39320 [Streptomyces galilaeus]